MKKNNAAIYMLSSRKDNLYDCIKSLYECWNNNYDYPVYIHYFDQIYDDSDFQKKFYDISNNIYFKSIKYRIPFSIKYRDLFFNRQYLNYVKNSFSEDRLGYLHMEYFVSDIYNFGKIGVGCKELKKYDFLMRIDDDIKFNNPIEFDLFEKTKGHPIATGHAWSRTEEELKNNNDYFDVRENLYSFIKEYVFENNIHVENNKLRQSIENNKEILMHTLKWSAGNLNIYDMKYFNNLIFKKYISKINKYGGAYKHRWGDQEILGLFNYIHYDIPLLDLNLQKNNLYEPRIKNTTYAPSVRKNKYFTFRKKFINFLRKIFRKIFRQP